MGFKCTNTEGKVKNAFNDGCAKKMCIFSTQVPFSKTYKKKRRLLETVGADKYKTRWALSVLGTDEFYTNTIEGCAKTMHIKFSTQLHFQKRTKKHAYAKSITKDISQCVLMWRVFLLVNSIPATLSVNFLAYSQQPLVYYDVYINVFYSHAHTHTHPHTHTHTHTLNITASQSTH